MLKTLLAVLVLGLAAACGGGGAANSGNPGTSKPMPVGALMTEYTNSKEETVAKYDGKTLIVEGFATTEPIMPTGADDAGILVIMEKGGDTLKALACHFTAAEKAHFADVKAGQKVVITGVFADDISTRLKSCNRIKTE